MPHISISEIQYVHTNYQKLCDIINTNLYAIAFVKFMIYKFYICDLCDTNCSYYTGHRSTLVKINSFRNIRCNLFSWLQYWCLWGFIYFKTKYSRLKQMKASKKSWSSSGYSDDYIVRKSGVSAVLLIISSGNIRLQHSFGITQSME